MHVFAAGGKPYYDLKSRNKKNTFPEAKEGAIREIADSVKAAEVIGGGRARGLFDAAIRSLPFALLLRSRALSTRQRARDPQTPVRSRKTSPRVETLHQDPRIFPTRVGALQLRLDRAALPGHQCDVVVAINRR